MQRKNRSVPDKQAVKAGRIEITTKIGCRNACDYCPQETLLKAYACRSSEMVMSFETFRACIDKLPDYVVIHFSGMCEPWLNPNCTDMLLYAHSRGHRICVFSTLVGMQPTDVNRFQAVPFEAFTVHLPSMDGRERIPVDENYLLVLEMLKTSRIPTAYVHHGNALCPEIATLLNGDATSIPTSSRAGNLKRDYIHRMQRKKGSIECVRQHQQNVLLPNGEVILCCMDYGMRHLIGNLLTGDYAGLFQSPEFQNIQRGMQDPSIDILCRDCDMFASEVDYNCKANS